MLGLSPSAPGIAGGSYVTLGEGQSASRFAMLGLSPGTTPPVSDVGGNASHVPKITWPRRFAVEAFEPGDAATGSLRTLARARGAATELGDAVSALASLRIDYRVKAVELSDSASGVARGAVLTRAVIRESRDRADGSQRIGGRSRVRAAELVDRARGNANASWDDLAIAEAEYMLLGLTKG